jgi:hypothetical protein
MRSYKAFFIFVQSQGFYYSSLHNFRGMASLFRLIGLLTVIKAIRALIDSQMPLELAVSLASQIPKGLAEDPWAGLLWDTTNRRMITAAENQRVGVKVLFYGAGGDLSKLRTDTHKVLTELAGLLKRDPAEVELQRYVGLWR